MPLEPFLSSVARHYFDERGADIASLCFVFPSKRSLTFFRHYLSELASDTPIFAPRMLTISQLIEELYPQLKILDKTALLFELYEAYREVRAERDKQGKEGETGGTEEQVESFDDFIYWGNIILQDFDTCDRYLVNIRHLYNNLGDFKELADDFTHLTQEMRESIQSFWGSLPSLGDRHKDSEDGHKQRFLSFWRTLGPLYEAFNKRISEKNYTYEGHLYRLIAEYRDDVVNRLSKGIYFVFVGLFDVTPSERKLFTRLRKQEIAEFCWDKAVKIVQDKQHPAHSYLEELIQSFGQVKGPWDDSSASCLPESIKVVHAASLMAQVKGLPILLEQAEVSQADDHPTTAIILPDEGLLLPTASSIPEDFQHINISLGYPLNRTPIALLLKRWIKLLEFVSRRSDETTLPSDQLLGLLSERLISDYTPEASELIKAIRGRKRFFYPREELLSACKPPPLIHLLFSSIPSGSTLLDRIQEVLEYLATAEDNLPSLRTEERQEEVRDNTEEEKERLSDFDLEFIDHYLRLVKRLKGLPSPYIQSLHLSTLGHLLEEMVSTVTIPFEGDPLRGIQVMGLLETRSLHLENMIYLSAQEGVLPPSKYKSTLIPFTLRRGFGLPIGGTDDIGQDYTFFQSISRAKHLIFVVAPADAQRAGGEESRYINLLRYVYGVHIETQTLQLTSERQAFGAISKPKDEEVRRHLQEYLTPGGRTLSPSSLITYLSCPLRFYYESIKGLREEQDPTILLQSNDFGTILHDTMQAIYAELGESKISKEMLSGILDDRNKISNIIQAKYRELFKLDKGKKPLSGLAPIYCQMVETYARSILTFDKELTPFFYWESEQEHTATFQLKDGQVVHFKGKIDRVDEVHGHIRVVDYKTGKASLRLEEWDMLRKSDNKAILQTLLYCAFLSQAKGSSTDRDDQCISNRLYPAIYQLKSKGGLMTSNDSFDPLVKLPVEGGKSTAQPYSKVGEIFQAFMTEVLTELFDFEKPFEQTTDNDACRYCPFALSCGRSLKRS